MNEPLSAAEAMRAAFRNNVHTPHSILRRLNEMGYVIQPAAPPPSPEPLGLIPHTCPYCGGLHSAKPFPDTGQNPLLEVSIADAIDERGASQ